MEFQATICCKTYIHMQEKKVMVQSSNGMEFRNKKKGWHNSAVRMEFGNHRIYSIPYTADAYSIGFLRNITLKSSCYDCHFRNFTAGSDIILGDFWGAEVELPEDDNKGISAILVNSGKGMDIIDRCNLALTPANVETVIKYNKNLLCSAAPSHKGVHSMQVQIRTDLRRQYGDIWKKALFKS